MKELGMLKQITNENYQLRYGTTDRRHYTSQFINVSGWASTIMSNELDIEREIRKLDKRLRQGIYFLTLEHPELENRFIVDFESAASGYIKKERTYYQVEATIFAKILSPKTYASISLSTTQEVIDAVITTLEDNTVFTFERDKPKKALERA
ncbi:MAG: hypothetical protein EOO51_14575 [Flavobacterium sp.]|nr:MAG: hypothetical protein EOO51_14575 [Flavobacterium sp.]